MRILMSACRVFNLINSRNKRERLLRIFLLFATVVWLTFTSALSASAQVNIINTVAGGGTPSPNANTLDLPGPAAIVEDASGNFYVAAPYLYQVLKITGAGSVSVFAGRGVQGFSGDNGAATSALLSSPSALAFNAAGDLYIADLNRIRCVLAVTGGCGGASSGIGTIVTVAGNGKVCAPTWDVCGDGGPAINANLRAPQGVVIDGSGDVFIADTQDQRIRCVVAVTGGCEGAKSGVGTIVTVAGTGHICDGPTEHCGDGGPANSAKFDMPTGVTFDLAGNIWITDTRDQKIRCVIESPSGCAGDTHPIGTVVTVVGTGQYCVDPMKACGDGLPPLQAHLLNPAGLVFDSAGNLYFADQSDNKVRAVTPPPNSFITTIAGDGQQGFCGDGGAPKSACLDQPYDLLIDSQGVLWIADTGNQRIREVAKNVISTFAGGGMGGDGGPATAAVLANPVNVSWDAAGNYFIADAANNRIRKVTAGKNGTISTVAGTGSAGWAGDGGPAVNALLQSPGAVLVDSAGDIFVADSGNFVVREVAAGTGNITTVAGTHGKQCSPSNDLCGDGGPGTAALLVDPTSLALDSSQSNLYIADYFGNRIRVLNLATGTIDSAAGTGTRGNSGDNGPAKAATLNHPWGIAFDNANNLYIADSDNNRMRCVLAVANGCGGSTAPVGDIVPFAFTGKTGFSGDGGPIANAKMTGPLAMASDPGNNLYVGAGVYSLVRRIDAGTLTIDTVAGNPSKPTNASFCGDGGLATKACINNAGMSVNSSLDLLIGDAGNNRIRQTHMVPAATANPTELDFGDVTVGQPSKPMTVTFTNTGAADLPLGDFNIVFSDNGDFTITGKTCGSSLAPGLKCTVTVVFTPQAQGLRTSHLKNTDYPQWILLTGTGT